MAFDKLRNLLAVGGYRDGLLKIFGAPSIEVTLQTTNTEIGTGRIYFLEFLYTSLLVCYEHLIELWDVDKQKVLHHWSFNESIESVHHPFNRNHLYLGFSNGSVKVLNLLKGCITTYKITLEDLDIGKFPPSRLPSVISVRPNPKNDNILLIAFETSHVVEWEVSTRKVRTTYGPLKSTLLCIAWHPKGNEFLTGHENGDLVLWKPKSPQPVKRITLTSAEKRKGVRNIVFSSASKEAGNNICYILGGNSANDHLAIHLITFDPQYAVKMEESTRLVWEDVDVVEMIVLFDNPWEEEAYNPHSLVCITNNGRLWAYKLQQTKYFRIQEPPPFIVQDSNILSLQSYVCSADFISSLRKHSNMPREWTSRTMPWPCSGGKFANKDVRVTPRVVVTACVSSSLL